MSWLSFALLSAALAESPAPAVRTAATVTEMLGLVSKEDAQRALDARIAEFAGCNADLEGGRLGYAVKTDSADRVVLNATKVNTLRSATAAACIAEILDDVRWPRPDRHGATYGIEVSFAKEDAPAPDPVPATP